jgi:hypothetical protein
MERQKHKSHTLEALDAEPNPSSRPRHDNERPPAYRSFDLIYWLVTSFLVVVGLFRLAGALAMETSVPNLDGTSVHNLALAHSQLVGVVVGCFMTFTGLLLAALDHLKQ